MLNALQKMAIKDCDNLISKSKEDYTASSLYVFGSDENTSLINSAHKKLSKAQFILAALYDSDKEQ